MAEASVASIKKAGHQATTRAPASDARGRPDRARLRTLLVIAATILAAIALAPIAVGLSMALVLETLVARPYSALSRRVGARAARAITLAGLVAGLVVPMLWLGEHMMTRLPAVIESLRRARIAAGSSQL